MAKNSPKLAPPAAGSCVGATGSDNKPKPQSKLNYTFSDGVTCKQKKRPCRLDSPQPSGPLRNYTSCRHQHRAAAGAMHHHMLDPLIYEDPDRRRMRCAQSTAFKNLSSYLDESVPCYRKKLCRAGVGVPAEAPQPLDFRVPEQIKQLIDYSTDDGSASLRSIYGLQTHPGVHCVRIPSVRVWFSCCTLQRRGVAAEASLLLPQACFSCRQACPRPRNAPSWRTSPVSCLSRQRPQTSLLHMARCRDCGVQRQRCSHLMSRWIGVNKAFAVYSCPAATITSSRQSVGLMVAMRADMQGRMHAGPAAAGSIRQAALDGCGCSTPCRQRKQTNSSTVLNAGQCSAGRLRLPGCTGLGAPQGSQHAAGRRARQQPCVVRQHVVCRRHCRGGNSAAAQAAVADSRAPLRLD